MFNLRAIVCAALLLLPAVALGFDPRVIRVGDKLKITFFETMDLPDVPGLGKGSADDAKMRVFYQRLDLSGDFTVDASGAVTMPILGAVDAAGRSATQLRDGVLAALEKAVGRAGNVSVAILQRQPVFVTGSVRNPGAYAYIPGMIAIQAVALAGGAKRDVDLSSVASRVDRRNQADSASDRLRKALARKAVLSAARDGAASVTAPPALVKLVGQDGADALIDAEKKAARLRVQEKQNATGAKEGGGLCDPVGNRGDSRATSRISPPRSNRRANSSPKWRACWRTRSSSTSASALCAATSSISRDGAARTISSSPRPTAASRRRRPT